MKEGEDGEKEDIVLWRKKTDQIRMFLLIRATLLFSLGGMRLYSYSFISSIFSQELSIFKSLNKLDNKCSSNCFT